MSKNKNPVSAVKSDENEYQWQPLASISVIRQRARLFQQIRHFMHERNIMEVDTPVISRSGNSDPYIHSMNLKKQHINYYLHTSPEYCMKRLLAANIGSIYQIARVFRDEEISQQHLQEFCLWEWYRVGFDYYQLMDEVADFIQWIGLATPERITYQAVFEQTLSINPHTASISILNQYACQYGWQTESKDRHELLDFLFSSVVIKNTVLPTCLIIFDYPECMAALATLKKTEPVVSERFELFIKQMEIANGFNELPDATEQRKRFESELAIRKAKGLSAAPIDNRLLAALKAGLPKAAGVALGVDRLLMVLTEITDINQVNTFSLLNN